MSKTTDSQVTTLDDEGGADEVAVAVAPAPAPKKGAAAKSAHNVGKKMVTLTIHAGQGDGGNDAVFLSHNEYARLIPRNLPVEVPEEVVAVLDMAVHTTYSVEGKNVVERQVPRYAYTVRA